MRIARRGKTITGIVIVLSLLGTLAYDPALKRFRKYRIDKALKERFAEIKPVRLKNCTMERIGSPNDGGYMICQNLLENAETAYSYGIAGRDSWGCDISNLLKIKVHQYDCFDTTRPVCSGGHFVFHEECIGDKNETIEDRLFDTMENQIAKNNDSRKNIIVKMDVERAEWDSLKVTPDDVLAKISQLVVEFHGVDDDRFVDVMHRLKKHFYFVDIHFNNHTCINWARPFPAYVFEALLVNKKIAELDRSGAKPIYPNRKHQPNNLRRRDCQVVFR
jgi:hypothetical protein